MSAVNPMTRKMVERLPEWLDPPAWIPAPQPCKDCDQPIRLIKAKDAGGELRWHVVNADPDASGWVKVFLRDRTAAFHQGGAKLGTIEGDPYLSFRGHRCPNFRKEIVETSTPGLDKPGPVG